MNYFVGKFFCAGFLFLSLGDLVINNTLKACRSKNRMNTSWPMLMLLKVTKFRTKQLFSAYSYAIQRTKLQALPFFRCLNSKSGKLSRSSQNLVLKVESGVFVRDKEKNFVR